MRCYVTTPANTLPPQNPALSSLATQFDEHTLPWPPLPEENELDYDDSLSEHEIAPHIPDNDNDIEIEVD